MATTAVGPSTRVGMIGVCLDRQANHAFTQAAGLLTNGSMVANLTHYMGTERDVVRLLDGAQVRICAVDFDQNPDEAMRTTERIKAEAPDVFVFAVSSSPDTERIIAAMRAGASEYLSKPVASDRLMAAIAHVQSKQKELMRVKGRGKVITLLGAKGGTGVTTLALHLALHLSAMGKHKTLLVDQHPALGDVSLYMGTGRHEYSFYELASNTERLDQELLKGFLLQHESGVEVLDSPENIDAVHYAPGGAIEETIAFLAEHYEYTVVDCPPGLSEASLATLAQSDELAIVITAEIPSVRNAVRYMEHLAKLGYPEPNIRVVLNRHCKRGPLPDEKIEAALHRPISIKVPNNYVDIIRAINTGLPIMPGQKSEFSEAMEKWAQEFHPRQTPKSFAAAAGRRTLLGLLGTWM